MVKIIYHDFGTVLAVGLEGKKRTEILQQFYSFYNLGATNGELQWETDKFAFFWTQPKKFEKWLKKSSIRLYFQDFYKKKKTIGKILRDIKTLINLRKNKIKEEPFIKIDTEQRERYKLAEIDPKSLYDNQI